MSGLTIDAAAIIILREQRADGSYMPKTINQILREGMAMGKPMYSFRNRKSEINKRYRRIMGIECETCANDRTLEHIEHELIHYFSTSKTYQIIGNLPVFLLGQSPEVTIVQEPMTYEGGFSDEALNGYRCCESGLFGQKHECMKQPGETQGQLFEVQDEPKKRPYH